MKSTTKEEAATAAARARSSACTQAGKEGYKEGEGARGRGRERNAGKPLSRRSVAVARPEVGGDEVGCLELSVRRGRVRHRREEEEELSHLEDNVGRSDRSSVLILIISRGE